MFMYEAKKLLKKLIVEQGGHPCNCNSTFFMFLNSEAARGEKTILESANFHHKTNQK